MRTSGHLSIAALVVLASTGQAMAAGYFVSTTGDDNAAGTSAAPWKTLQKAAGKVVAGDTVTVADGTYAGFACNGKKGTADARIVFKAANKGGAKINAGGAGASAEDFVQLSSCSYVTVDGFEVSGAPRSGIAILGNQDDGSDARDVIIQNNHSHHNGGPKAAGRHDGIFSGFALNLTVQDNEVHDNSEHGIYVSNAADNPIIRRNHVYAVGVNCAQINADLSTGGDGLISNWLIEGNVMHNCGSAAFNLDGAVRGVMQNNLVYDCVKGGITLFQGDGAEASHDNLIVNNTVYNPAGTRAALQVAAQANNNVVFNNILYSKAAGLEIQDVTGLVHDYNFVSSYDGGSASAHETSTDPAMLFADVAGRKLTLAAASPALDSGVATLGGKTAPAVDIEGKPRPSGSVHDRGCFETAKGGGAIPGADAGVRPDAATGTPTPTADAGTKDASGPTNGGAGATGNGAAGAGSPPATGAAGSSAPPGPAGVAGSSPPPSNTGAAGGTPVTIPNRKDGGCSLGNGPPSAATWSSLAALALLATASRRRRSR